MVVDLTPSWPMENKKNNNNYQELDSRHKRLKDRKKIKSQRIWTWKFSFFAILRVYN